VDRDLLLPNNQKSLLLCSACISISAQVVTLDLYSSASVLEEISRRDKMSASPVARQVTQSQVIPSRRIVITNSADLPNDYSTTPGGTFFSTTPGGTRIVYERNLLLQLRNSPMARTPPKNIQFIPGVSPSKKSGLCENNNTTQKTLIDSNPGSPDRLAPDTARVTPIAIAQSRPAAGDNEQFEMDL